MRPSVVQRINFNATQYTSIQVLRAVAALSVLLYHAGLFNIGYGGVDVFFVISGFIMGTIGVREAPNEFFGKRLIRIVPLYWAVTIAMCLLSLLPGAFQQFTFDLPRLVKSLLFIPHVDVPTGRVWPLLVPGWTLNYEMFFYAVFAIGLALGRPVMLSVTLMIALVATGLLVAPTNSIWATYTNPMLLEFVSGVALSPFQSAMRVDGDTACFLPRRYCSFSPPSQSA